MSQSNNRTRPIPRNRAGMSLVELLIALAIFVTVMGGVSALYSGAIRTVKQGYDTIDHFETARALLAVMDEDLETAFTAPQFGEFYQFYGRPDGFMYVGLLPGGDLGRVTYVVNPNASTNTFETVITEPYQFVAERAERQVRDWAFRYGLNANTVWNNFRVVFELNYPPPADPTFPIEFNVAITTQAVLRYEESGVKDLDTFNLASLPNGPGNPPAGYGIQWPYVDARDPLYDDPNGDSASAETAYESGLYAQLVSAINPRAPFSLALDLDLRELIRVTAFTSNESLFAVDPALVQSLLNTKRRDLWLDILAEDPTIGLPGFWNEGLINDPRKERKDYVIADDLLARARLLTADGGGFIDLLIPDNTGNVIPRLKIDALDITGAFSYANEEGVYNRQFNTLQRIPGYNEFQRDGGVIPSGELITNLDDDLTAFYNGPRVASTLSGVPLSPRVPALIQPGFWLMSEKPSPGAADFRRYFAQQVEVPAGASRNLPARFVSNNDQL